MLDRLSQYQASEPGSAVEFIESPSQRPLPGSSGIKPYTRSALRAKASAARLTEFQAKDLESEVAFSQMNESIISNHREIHSSPGL